MKKETYESKLAALLGLGEVKKEHDTKKEAAKTSKFVGIDEARIQSFREMQGVIYFLQAPSLFTLKTCPHCKEEFLVSRLYVSYCSYTCIVKSMEEEWGIKWSRADALEDPEDFNKKIIGDLYEGNEPIWIRNLPKLEAALTFLTSNQSSKSSPSNQDT